MDVDAPYTQTTRGISITVRPMFLEEQSVPDDGHFVWAYQVTIANQGSDIVQLLRRHWVITDGLGQVQDVEGPGVVGEQPVIKPGDKFAYTSGTPLPTPSGFMQGTYAMRVLESGEVFDVVVPTFSLDSPYAPLSIH